MTNMKQTQHTPGPWYLTDLGEVEHAGRLWLNDGKGFGMFADAAPDLLAACEALESRITIMRTLDQGGTDRMPIPKFLADARSAIARARGQS